MDEDPLSHSIVTKFASAYEMMDQEIPGAAGAAVDGPRFPPSFVEAW